MRYLLLGFSLIALGACDDASPGIEATKETTPASTEAKNVDLSCIPADIRATLNAADLRGSALCGSDGPTIAAISVGFISSELVEGLNKKWPLKVKSGFVGCTNGREAWFETADGTRYGVNGFATPKTGYTDIKPIWLLDDEFNRNATAENGVPPKTPFRISIGPLTEAANERC